MASMRFCIGGCVANKFEVRPFAASIGSEIYIFAVAVLAHRTGSFIPPITSSAVASPSGFRVS